MHELFLKARRFHDAGSGAYGDVLLLQVSYITLDIRISLTIPKAILSSPDLLEPSERATLQDHEIGLLYLLDRARPNP